MWRGENLINNTIKNIKLGKEDVTTEFIREHYESIYSYLYWKTKNKELAEDLTQEVFLKFIQNIGHYKNTGKPRAYLYTIARNLLFNHSRKKNSLSLEDIENKNSLEFIANHGDYHDKDSKEALLNALELLTGKQKELILLRYFHDLSMSEISHITTLSRFSIRYEINKAMKHLGTLIKKEDFYEKKY